MVGFAARSDYPATHHDAYDRPVLLLHEAPVVLVARPWPGAIRITRRVLAQSSGLLLGGFEGCGDVSVGDYRVDLT
jgi:hypothetical protein